MNSIPVTEALEETCSLLMQQTNFECEATNLKRLYEIFEQTNNVVVPRLHEDLCTPEILVMDLIPGLQKITDLNLPEHIAKKVLKIGVHSLYKMIFQVGFIHCDMHPGNILVTPDDKLVILDAGFMSVIDETTRRCFARFFLSIAFRDGLAAAKIVRATAQRLPKNLDVQVFDNDITNLIKKVGGLQAKDFQVADFVGQLFSIQHKHGIYGTNQFTTAIMSLLVLEGVTKQRFPDFNFQQEAVPFIMAALD
jgi:ubiquinone biosynthesis protein